MLLLLLLLFETWIAAEDNIEPVSSSGPNRNAYAFSMSWDIKMTANGLRASCIVTPDNHNFEEDRFQVVIDSPANFSNQSLETHTEIKDGSLKKHVLIPNPNDRALGKYVCRLLDKNASSTIQERIQNVSKLSDIAFEPKSSSKNLRNKPISLFNKWLIIILALVVVTVVAITVFISIRYRISNAHQGSDRRPPVFVVGETNGAYLHEDIRNLQYDLQFEVREQNLERLECIGGGHFGTVFNGIFKVSQQWPTSSQFGRYLTPLSVLSVAVKVPGDEEGRSDYTACQNILHDELKILCSVGSHPNIVTLIGAITTSNSNISIIVENCSNGSLLNFLKSKRENFVSLMIEAENTLEDDRSDYLQPTRKRRPSTEHQIPTNISKRSKITSKELTTAHLLSFSMQIALGMDHLSSKKCLHRDLAARNILVTDNLVCKIADFGLAKRTNRKDYYRVETNYDLPIRWMSREAVMDLKFTIESDIWSYGILLYEIFTLGGCPYPSISNSDVIQEIKNGILNEQPEFCPLPIYKHMLKCWDADPEKRPLFSSSADIFHNHLKLASQQVLQNVEKELSRERQRQSKLETLRTRSQYSNSIRV